MGIRVDGCGTYDGSKKIKLVGNFKCETCKAVYPFYINELTTKITVLFVPVAKISSSYAILCSHCGKGYKLDEMQKNKLMNGDISFLSGTLDIGDNKMVNAPATNQAVSQNTINIPTPTVPIHSNDQNSGDSCPRCGTARDANNSFCSKCGRKYDAPENKVSSVSQPVYCAKCGGVVKSGMLFCTSCGNKI
jgi:DNA-directed RNA polymerase subunit RPC12/RpoP